MNERLRLSITKRVRTLINFLQISNVLLKKVKTFDCIAHELLTAKTFVVFSHSYLRRRKQRTKRNSSYSAFAEALFVVPQDYIIGLLLFSIYIGDLFFESNDIDIDDYANRNYPVCQFTRI